MRLMRKHSRFHYHIYGYNRDNPDLLSFDEVWEGRIINTLPNAKREAVRVCKDLLTESDFRRGSFRIEISKELEGSSEQPTLCYRSLSLTHLYKSTDFRGVTINEESSKWIHTPEGREHKSWEIIHDTRIFEPMSD